MTFSLQAKKFVRRNSDIPKGYALENAGFISDEYAVTP